MRRLAIVLAAAALGGSYPARAHELATPPAAPHPMPQGTPYLVVGAVPHPVRTLRFALIDGRRALVDGRTMQVVYYLHP